MTLENRQPPKTEVKKEEKPKSGPQIRRHATLVHDFMVADPKVKAKLERQYPGVNLDERPNPMTDEEYRFELMKEFPEDFKVKEVPPDPSLNLGVSDEEMAEIDGSPLIKVGKIKFENTSAIERRKKAAEEFAAQQDERRNKKKNLSVKTKLADTQIQGSITSNYEQVKKSDGTVEKVTSISYKPDTNKWNNFFNKKFNIFDKWKLKNAVNKRNFYNEEYDNITEQLGEETAVEQNLLKDGTEIFNSYKEEKSKKRNPTYNQIKRDELKNEIGVKEESLSDSEKNLLKLERSKKDRVWKKHFDREASRGSKIEAEDLFEGDGFSLYESQNLPNHDTSKMVENKNKQLLLLLREQLNDAEASGSRTNIESILNEIDKVNKKIAAEEKKIQTIRKVEQMAEERIKSENTKKADVIKKIEAQVKQREHQKSRPIKKTKPVETNDKKEPKDKKPVAQEGIDSKDQILSDEKGEKLKNLLDDLGI